ncbi:facilitated trehalose transporter Tret1-like isoform X3 [Lycorma delicatula]|uniref:facilitated trehalose transporter Tret1-like isoform X3 n=1 Tax=Lycorma delicatula TaxID=130591 RepID=UPI003F51520C
MFENIQGRNQIFTAIVVSFAYASVGCNFAWTSPILPRLMEKDSKIPITEEQGSWVASLLAIGATVSPLMSCKLLDSLGRKNTLLLNTVLLLLGWTLIWLAYCLEILYVGRIITGLACGIFFLGLPMYIIEITEDSLRGALCCGIELSIAFGCNLEYFAGPYLSYNSLVMLSMVPPLIFLLVFLWLPDSPYYLISKGQKESAIKSLQWFRGNISKEMAEKESVIILSTMYEQMQKKAGIKDLIKVPGNRKGLWINFFLVTAGQFTGINVIQLYSELIFMKSGSNIPPKYCAMTVGTFQFISSLFAPSISKTFGYRKPLLLGAVIIGIEYHMALFRGQFLGKHFQQM